MPNGKDGNSRRKRVIGKREARLLPPSDAVGSVMAAAIAICALHGGSEGARRWKCNENANAFNHRDTEDTRGGFCSGGGWGAPLQWLLHRRLSAVRGIQDFR